MKRVQQFFLLSLTTITILGCAIMGPVSRIFAPSPTLPPTQTPTPTPTSTPTQTQTPTLAPTSTPAFLPTLSTVCDHMDNQVIVYGRISVPFSIEPGSFYRLDFDDNVGAFDPNGAAVPVLITVGEQKNQVYPLEDGYRESDLKITADDGRLIGNKFLVTILGVVQPDSRGPGNWCVINVQKIWHGKYP